MEQQTIRITVVTIVYNGVDSIATAIRSVIDQQYPNLEYIVVDGGSTDGTLDVLKGFGDQIQWISEPDEGISDAFNKGIRKATGQIIGLLNADDCYLPGTLQAVARGFRGEGVYYGAMQLIENNQPGGTYHPNHELLEKDMTLCHPATFITAGLYKKHGLYRTDYRYAMDYELLLRMKTSGAPFYCIPETLARMSTQGVSNMHWEEAFDEVQRARKLYLAPGPLDRYRIWVVKWRKRLGHALEGGPLAPAVAAYRRNFSTIRKT